MELLRIFIAAVMVFQFGLVAANNLPPILISGNESVYPGESVVFECHVDTTGIDLVTFQWVRIDGENATFFNETVDMETSGGGSADDGNYFFNSTLNVTDVNYTDNDVGYYCNASGCNVSMTAYLTVLSPMITSFTPAPQLLLEVNESGSLVCNALGGPRLVITIERDGSVFENGTMGDDIVEYNFMANNETFGNYTCTAMIDDMEMNESTLVVVAPYGVTIASGGELIQRPAVVEYGDTLTLTCSTSGGPDNMFSWSKDNTVIIESNILSISPVTPADGGEYQCMVSNNAGNSTANITIYVAPQFVMEPENVEMLIGSAVNLLCSANGFPAPDITWSFQGMPFNNNTVDSTNFTYSESTIVITDLMLSDGGTYSCSINSDAIAMPSTSEADVAVIGEMVMGLMDMLVFPGESASWDCQVQSTIPLQFMWYRNGMLVQNTTGSLMGGNTTSSSYMLTNVSYDYNASIVTCSATGSVLTVNSSEAAYLTVLLPNITGITIAPTPSAGGILLHQFNDTVSLTCTAEGGPRIMTRWQFDNGSTVADDGSSVTYDVSSLSTDDTGVYYCEAIIDGMSVTSVNYTLFVAPYEVEIMGIDMYPQGERLMLTCLSEGGPELNYSWLFEGSVIANTSILVIDNVSATDGGDYICNVTNAAGSDSENITVYIGVVITTHPQDELVNVSGSVNFTCEASGSSPINYRWLYNGSYIMNDPGHIEGVNTSTLLIVNVNVTDWGLYSCEASNIVDNITSNGATLYVSPLGTVDVTPNDMAVDHMTNSVTFTCQSMAGPNLNYTWLINGSSEALNNADIVVNDFQLTVNNVTYLLGGRYTCVVSNMAGQGEDSSDLFVNPLIITDPESQLALDGDTVNFTCTAIAFPAPVYNWSTPIPNTDFNTSTITILVDFFYYGNYICFAESNGTIATSLPALLTVAPYDAIITETVDNNNVTYTCNAEGGPGNTYEWLRLRDNETVSVTQELTLDNTDPLDGGDYQCTITNTAGNTSAMITLNVATVIVTSPQTQNVTAGESFTLLCNATGYPVPSMEWTLNGTSYIIEDPSIATIMPLEGLRSNSSNLTVTSAMTNDTGIYECVATNVVNNDTQDANVTVQNCPDEPINVQIFDVNSRNLTINWTEPHDNNDPITQYSISYQNPDCLVDAINVTQNVTVTSMEEQVTINNLHPGEYYTFTIIAINDICPSQPSLPASMRTEEEVPGAAPVVSTNASQRSINVSWMMLECQDRRGNITMYEVRYTSTDFGDNVDQTLTTSSGAELSLEVDGLEEFTNYTIEVRAYTAIGPGPYSDPINVRTLPDIPSGPVNNLTAMDATPTSVNLSWNPVNERDQNGIILSYNIHYRLNESSGPDMMILDVIGRSRTVGSLMENEVYEFAVTAVNQVGESMVNASVIIQTNESAPSTPPVNVVIFNVTDGDNIAVDITWGPPNDPNGIIRYYRVEFVEASDPLDNGGPGNTYCPLLGNTVMNMFVNNTPTGIGAATNARLSGLVAYRMYNYSIFPATSVGEGPSADGSFLTRENTPLAPQNLTVSIPGVARNSTTLLVNWERPLCDRGVLSGYELCYVESSIGDCNSNGVAVNITDPDQLSYTINDLSINTNYIVEVRGRTGAGLGDPASANGTTDEDAPDPVMNVTTQFSPNNTTRGYYNITWTPPAPINGSFYQTLEYSYSSAYSVGPTYNGAFNITLDQSQNYYIFDALYYTDYSFSITTINVKYAIDNGPALFSNQSSPAVPTAVRDIRIAMSTPESLYITWDHPEYPNSQLLNYIFYYNDNPAMLQSGSEISPNGFENVTLEIVTSYNLTGLSPFTNYTILITVTGRGVGNAPFAMELLQRTNAAVPNGTLVLPNITTPLPSPSTGTITVLLPQPEQIMTGIVEVYAVIVVTGDLLMATRARRNTDDSLRSPRDIIRDNGDRLPDPYNPNDPMDLYTAAVWTNPADVPDIFVVGSDTTTRGPDGREYFNAELAEGTEYGVFDYIRLESDDENPGPLLVPNDYLAVTSTEVTAEDSNAGAIAAGVIIPLIVIAAIIVGVIVFIWYYRRRRYIKHDLYTGEVAYTESENVVLNPVAPQPYLGTFQPIPVTEFRNHVNKMHADSDYRFSEEYAAVEPEHSPTTEATLAPSNTNKNRYANISAYDHSRVRLRVQSEDETDYINANYIDGYKRKNAYIATQGPVPDTFISFWRMVWECESQTIVMLTNLEEKGRVKCHQYWPDDKVKVPGNIRVATLEQLELAEYTVRTFSLKREGSKEERIVKQFHYTTWPDFGVPTHPTPVLRFTRRILTTDHQDAGPIIVHCSAGVGRSGTFITLHSQLQRISAEGTIDIFPFVRQMRYRRCHMVQTEPQYVFIHDALLEAIECGETEVAARDLKAQYRKLSGPSDDDHKKQLIEEEFKRIDDSIHISGDHTSGQTPANKAKNRYANVLPYDGSRCRISAIPGQEGSDYINASYIDGYLKQKAYVATQGPLPDTAAEFWRMIWELKCATIVMLVKEREQGRVKCHHYWPDTGAETFGQYQVVAHSCNEYAEYTLREFKLVDKKDNSSLPVRHFQFTSWPENGTVPENSSGLIDLIGQVQKWQQNSGNKPITVHCSGGSGRTGTYIAISILLDRLKVEGVVDVFQTVRGLRLQRMHMVQTLAQYEFCYTTILEFLDSFELYSNFK